MSTRYGIHCQTCNADSDYVSQTDRQTVEQLITNAPKLKDLYGATGELLNASQGILSIRLEMDGIPFNCDQPFFWLGFHGDHKLRLMDEYGKVYE